MDVARVPLGTATQAPSGRTNAYVLGGQDALLVDPAVETAELDEHCREGSIAHVAVTHFHPDHVGAVGTYASRLDATVWAPAGRETEFERVVGVTPDRSYRPGDRIPTGDGPVRVLDTPGHAPEHVAFTWADGAAVGDLAVADGSVVVGAPDGDMRAYLTSLRRLRARQYDTLYPGHGPPIDDPTRTLKRLLRHRLDREGRVLEAVTAGATTVEEILEAAYEKSLAGVRDLARATVVCHLEKLVVEGRVRWDGTEAAPAG